MRTHGPSEELSAVGMARGQRMRGRWLEMRKVVGRSAEPCRPGPGIWALSEAALKGGQQEGELH